MGKKGDVAGFKKKMKREAEDMHVTDKESDASVLQWLCNQLLPETSVPWSNKGCELNNTGTGIGRVLRVDGLLRNRSGCGPNRGGRGRGLTIEQVCPVKSAPQL